MNDEEQIVSVLRGAGLAHFEPQVRRLMRRAILLRPTPAQGDLALGASRFGGDPDLPPGAPWPERDGVPMPFVAQLRLAELAPFDVEHVLPDRGSLLFFHNEQWETSEMCNAMAPAISAWKLARDPAHAAYVFSCARVLFWDGDDEALVRTAAPRVAYEDVYGARVAPEVAPCSRVAFTAMVDVPGQTSAFLEGDELRELREAWVDFLARPGGVLPPANQFTELYDASGAPRYQHHKMLGYPSSADDLEAMSTDDVLLLQLDSDCVCGFQWGEYARLHFIAAREDLERRDFSRVRLHREL